MSVSQTIPTLNNMKGIIITNQSNDHNVNKINRLLEEAPKLNMELSVIVNDGTLAKIEKGNVIINLDCDFIIYLDKDIYLSKMLEKNGYLVFNDSNFLKTCDDKTLTYIALANHNIRMPLTMSGPLIYKNELSEDNYLFLDKVIETLSLPLIAKKVYGSLGEDVHLINNKEELREFYSKNFMHPIQFQEYISSSYGRSVRVLVIDHQIFGAFERYNTSDFRSNYHGSAYGKNIELDEKYVTFVSKIIDLMDIKYAGIDLLFGNEEPILCEVNSNAFFEVFEKVTGKNVAFAYLQMIKKYTEEK